MFSSQAGLLRGPQYSASSKPFWTSTTSKAVLSVTTLMVTRSPRSRSATRARAGTCRRAGGRGADRRRHALIADGAGRRDHRRGRAQLADQGLLVGELERERRASPAVRGSRPAARSRSSTAPGSCSVARGGSRPSRAPPSRPSPRAGRSPRADRGRPRAPARPVCATRPASRSASTGSAANQNEVKLVTASKAASAHGSCLQVAHAQVGLRNVSSRASSSSAAEPSRPADPRPAVGGDAQERPGAAAEVEHRAGAPSRLSAALIDGPVLALVLGPAGGVCAPDIGHATQPSTSAPRIALRRWQDAG